MYQRRQRRSVVSVKSRTGRPCALNNTRHVPTTPFPVTGHDVNIWWRAIRQRSRPRATEFSRFVLVFRHIIYLEHFDFDDGVLFCRGVGRTGETREWTPIVCPCAPPQHVRVHVFPVRIVLHAARILCAMLNYYLSRMTKHLRERTRKVSKEPIFRSYRSQNVS